MNQSPLKLARYAVLTLAVLTGPVIVAPNSWQAYAYDTSSTSSLNVDKSGVAIRGYDPVAYFTLGKPTKGNPKFSMKHNGATYHFATLKNKETFASNPAKYAPAFGGFCAMGTVFEKKIDGDPTVWKIVDGKLYLNVGTPTQKRWLEDVPGNIKTGEGNWTKIKDKAPKDL